MPTVQLSQRPVLVLAGAVVLHIILISAQVNTRTGIPLLQVATFGFFAEIQRATMTTVSRVRNLWTGYVDLRSAQTENESLKRELQRLQIRLQEEHALAQRTESLRQLLELRQRSRLETVAAEIIASGPSDEFRTITIDKGSTDGLKRDMAVISPNGVIGRVNLPSGRASQVQLLIDRNAAAGALIERTRAQGIVAGQGGDTLLMEYVPSSADVKPGDLVVTSGIDAIYPKGFVIGTVQSVERGPGIFHKITIRPAVDFSRLEEVLVVTTPPAVKQAEAEEAAIAARRAQPPSAESASTNQSAASPRPGNQSPRTARPRTPPAGLPSAVPPATNQGPRRPPGTTQPPRRPAANQTPQRPGVLPGAGE